MQTYILDGIPSDLLTNDSLGERRFKVEATQSSIPSSELLIDKTFTYNPDDTVATITFTNKTTGISLVKTFSYTNGQVTSITETIL